MNPVAERARRLLPGLWAGFLVCVALVATPAPFATLVPAEAGRVVSHIFAREGYASLAVGLLLLILEREVARQQAEAGTGSQFSTGMLLALAALFCTVVGYFAIQPMLPAAKAGQGPLSFGQLHALSLGLFGLKILATVALAWRASAPRAISRSASF
jgi:hypothetical protein